MKRIVVLIDGTWNTYFKRSKREHNDWSNVHKLRSFIARRDREGTTQITLYTRGVGTSHFFDQVLGGIRGAGIEEQILDSYMSLSDNYEEGDEIYLVGFSRGAVAVRALAGLIKQCRLLRGGCLDRIGEIWAYYISLYKDPSRLAANAFETIEPFVSTREIKIECIAVWDTVAGDGFSAATIGDPHNVGVAAEILAKAKKLLLSDLTLGSNVKMGLHAISIDEERDLFEPLLWQPGTGRRPKIRQVLFAGSHSDIGGGYKQRGLSDITLTWMIYWLGEAGLYFENHSSYVFQSTIAQGMHRTPPGWKWGGIGNRQFVLDDSRVPGVKLHSSALALLGRNCTLLDGTGRGDGAGSKVFLPEFLSAIRERRQILECHVEDPLKYPDFLSQLGLSNDADGVIEIV